MQGMVVDFVPQIQIEFGRSSTVEGTSRSGRAWGRLRSKWSRPVLTESVRRPELPAPIHFRRLRTGGRQRKAPAPRRTGLPQTIRIQGKSLEALIVLLLEQSTYRPLEPGDADISRSVSIRSPARSYPRPFGGSCLQWVVRPSGTSQRCLSAPILMGQSPRRECEIERTDRFPYGFLRLAACGGTRVSAEMGEASG